ncbi:hypothetical protein OEZ49_01465 [Ruegeria sp. WL0004]|uniref:Uncharacterized protein n=1 Tax=Ruegeria marisflavi TaxID=2984152 RepID=A0ABT2WN67_9RHOB|nr:hypothetical protein [Ruegeria sp. WL0004]MCU9836425.1 hypothetical protein [Ruegeria sp. WL0004]
MTGVADIISTYILAKDNNRPWLMQRAFSERARLEMDVRTDAIAFPSVAVGLDEITQTLVRRFSSENENVYTFCLTKAPTDDALQFTCNWLVGMTRKETGEVRVGCGSYAWTFLNQPEPLVGALKITIEVMELLDQHHTHSIMRWLSALPYPWCPAEAALRGAPRSRALAPVTDFLAQAVPG